MTLRLSLASLGLACWLAATSLAADKDKIEVLARGPVHEGYAEPAEREPAASPVIPKDPPKTIEELPPDQKPEGDNVQWIPGYWAFDEEKKDFLWVSGFWRNAPPGRSWVPGSWRKTDAGWQWTGGFWTGAKEDKADVEYLPKPPAPLDNQGATTPAPSENHVYVPGSWVWRDRYMWRPGFYTEVRSGWVWTSAHYRWTPAGYIFIDGYWDYPLADRGMLFAPAYIPPAVYAEPAFVYTPTVVVREECLYGAFFARRGFGSYFFGDYFAPSYASLGFVGWGGHVSASISIGGWCDPLFSYYSCAFRGDAFWGGGIGNLYCGRFRGDFMRPPTTLIQQNTVINNITNNTTVNNNNNVSNVTMLTSLNEAGRGGRRNLQTVSETDRRSELEAARNVRATGERRANAESQLASTRPGAGAVNTPRSAKLDVAKRPAAPASQLTPKGSNPTAKGPAVTPKSGGAVNPPAPKATALGNPTPKGPGSTIGGNVNPSIPKSPGIAGGGNVNPPTPKTPGNIGGNVNPPSKGPSNPAPITRPPTTSPSIPKAGPSNPAPITRPPTTSPSIPKAGPSNPAPITRPPTTSPSIPKNVAPPTRPAAPPKATPKASPKPPVASLPNVAPPVARAAAPSIPRMTAPPVQAPRANPAPINRAPAARPAPAVRSAPARPAPAVRSAPARPAVRSAPPVRSAPRAAPARPSGGRKR